MNWVAPQPPGTSHRLEECDCGKPALTDWLLNQARHAQGSGSARTFVACDQDRVAGYYSLTVGQIDTGEAPERIRRGMGQYPIPSMPRPMRFIGALVSIQRPYESGS